MGSLAESTSYIFGKSNQSQSQISAGSNNSDGGASGGKETYSVFGESSCGEPLFDQHVVLDFTSDKDIDTDYMQEKCCQFWDFINSVPEIQNLIVLPEKINDTKPDTQVISDTSKSDLEDVSVDVEKTAVSMLELTEEKGLINRIFEAKLPKSMCSLGSREYKETDKITDRKKTPMTARAKKKTDRKDKERQRHKEKEADAEQTAKNVKLKNMINTMDEWDFKHPKSMEPPGHPPKMHHCFLQRL